MLRNRQQSSLNSKKLHDKTTWSSDTFRMDELDSARVLIVEAIETLEVAIEQLIPAQAPTSTERQIRSGVQTIEYTSNSLTDFAKRVQSALPEVEGS